jgi:SNF2 family DNA or RNA helicase
MNDCIILVHSMFTFGKKTEFVGGHGSIKYTNLNFYTEHNYEIYTGSNMTQFLLTKYPQTVYLSRYLITIMGTNLYDILLFWKENSEKKKETKTNEKKTRMQIIPGEVIIIVKLYYSRFKELISDAELYNNNKCYIKFIMETLDKHADNVWNDKQIKRNSTGYLHQQSIEEKIIDKIMMPIINEDYVCSKKLQKMIKCVIPELFNYQKATIDWMIGIENSVKKIEYRPQYRYIFRDIGLFRNRFYSVSDISKELRFYGGGLLDEMGLGKTLQMTVLSLINKDPYNILTDFLYDNTKLNGGATLVLCPNQLAHQWKTEIETTIKNIDVKIILLLTKRDFDKLTYADLLQADFVITTYNFLNNAAYTRYLPMNLMKKNGYMSDDDENDSYVETKITKALNEFGKQLVENAINYVYNLFYIKKPLLHNIHWKRLIIDEFHEVFNNRKYKHVKMMLPRILSQYKWCVTGTPFTGFHSILHTIKYLTDNYNIDESVLQNPNTPDIIASLFRRNTKDTVKNELKLPPIKDEVLWLEFTPSERILYTTYLQNPKNSEEDSYLRQLCCHPNLANETKAFLEHCSTLKDIEQSMIKYYSSDLQIFKAKRRELKKHIKQVRFNLRFIGERLNPDDEPSSDSDEDFVFNEFKGRPGDIAILYSRLDRFTDEYKRLGIMISGKENSLTFLKNVLDKLKSIETNNVLDKCAICLSYIEKDNLGITNCGHIYCYSCLQEMFVATNKCPYCKNVLTPGSYFKLVGNHTKKKVDTSFNTLLNKVGTKLANLIQYLQKNRDKKFILFSQWDNLLIKVGIILDEHGIKNKFCKGNCHQRTNAIKKFSTDNNMSVIMLSLTNTASGTNLTKASHIIILDSVLGTPKYIMDVENQALARAVRLGQKNEHVTVVRFLIKNTIEEKIYNKVKNQINQNNTHVI